MTLEQLIVDLKDFITEHPNLVKTDIASAIGVKPSGLCNLLSRDSNPTGAQVLKIQELTRDTNGLRAVNQAAQQRLEKSGAHVVGLQVNGKRIS